MCAQPHAGVLGVTAASSPIPFLPSTSTRQGSADSSETEAAFTAVTRIVTVVPGAVELGGVRPVAVRLYVSAGQLDPRYPELIPYASTVRVFAVFWNRLVCPRMSNVTVELGWKPKSV